MQRVGRVLSPDFVKASEAAAFIARMMAKEAKLRGVRNVRASGTVISPSKTPPPPKVPPVSPVPMTGVPAPANQQHSRPRPAHLRRPEVVNIGGTPTGTVVGAPSPSYRAPTFTDRPAPQAGAGQVQPPQAGPPPPVHPSLQAQLDRRPSVPPAQAPAGQVEAPPGLWGKVKDRAKGMWPFARRPAVAPPTQAPAQAPAQAPTGQVRAPTQAPAQTQAPTGQVQAPASPSSAGEGYAANTGRPLEQLQGQPGSAQVAPQGEAPPGLWDRVKWPLAGAAGLGALGVYGMGSGLASAAQSASQMMAQPGMYPGAYSTPLPARSSPYGY